jgi:hypothetical protein
METRSKVSRSENAKSVDLLRFADGEAPAVDLQTGPPPTGPTIPTGVGGSMQMEISEAILATWTGDGTEGASTWQPGLSDFPATSAQLQLSILSP